MKKIVNILSMIVLAFAFLLSGCTSDPETTTSEESTAKSKLPEMNADLIEIGYIKDGMPYITFDTKKALTKLSENMKKYANIDANYTSVYVANIDDTYNLLFEGDIYRTSFYVEVIESPKKLVGATVTTIAARPKITCTTSECSHEPEGCLVRYDNDNTGLPFCNPCANGGECIKTAVSSEDAVAASVATGVF